MAVQVRALGAVELPVVGVVVPAMRVSPERVLSERVLSEGEARRLLMFVVEALEGRRSLGQLVGVVGEEAVRELRVGVGAGAGRVRLGTVRVCRVGGGVAEVSGTLGRDGRVRAVAARVEYLDGGWVCVVFKVLE
ncbi:Rv3235 family protein [Umezawaea endophytica]|uniref:Rv3235 family protein n=1 Tax=Umezawaea endophytica TaxID=1654476 RepID=A0A9X2VSZ9_9PSEU|nr:Rv3235 family protein [Umezawaea endophytica]MCS7481672.1 Rv3235 family protein [Umezawaea endophytica]